MTLTLVPIRQGGHGLVCQPRAAGLEKLHSWCCGLGVGLLRCGTTLPSRSGEKGEERKEPEAGGTAGSGVQGQIWSEMACPP